MLNRVFSGGDPLSIRGGPFGIRGKRLIHVLWKLEPSPVPYFLVVARLKLRPSTVVRSLLVACLIPALPLVSFVLTSRSLWPSLACLA